MEDTTSNSILSTVTNIKQNLELIISNNNDTLRVIDKHTYQLETIFDFIKEQRESNKILQGILASLSETSIRHEDRICTIEKNAITNSDTKDKAFDKFWKIATPFIGLILGIISALIIFHFKK